MENNCATCGEPLETWNSRYCPKCRIVRNREYRRKYYAEKYKDPHSRKKLMDYSRKYKAQKRRELITRIYGRLIEKCEGCDDALRFISYKNEKGTAIKKGSLAMHHLSDEAYGNEERDNVAILCFKCHIHANLLKQHFGVIDKTKLLMILHEFKDFHATPTNKFRVQVLKNWQLP